MRVKVYTDGACKGNPGPGGWAAVFVYSGGCRHLAGYAYDTTNNVMELTAVLEVLRHVIRKADGVRQHHNSIDYHLYCDSAYVVNAINEKWYKKWEGNGWKTSKGGSVMNRTLWEQFIELRQQIKRLGISFAYIKVKGHSGNPYNEMVDRLAVEQAMLAKVKDGV